MEYKTNAKEKMMSCDYVQVINNFLNITKGVSKDRISPDDIDKFLETLTDVYVAMLEKGIVSLEANSIQFKSDITKKFFVASFTCIQEGAIPDTLELILEFLFLQTSREQAASLTELFEIYLLAKIMPTLLPEGDYIKKYLHFLIEFCSSNIQHFQLAKFNELPRHYWRKN
jgi:hypothetical protein